MIEISPKGIRFSMDDDTKKEWQLALYKAYSCAWRSIVPLWLETDRASCSKREFPELDISQLTVVQASVYLNGLKHEIEEMLRHLGVDRLEPSLGLSGRYLSAPAEFWPREEIEAWILHEKDPLNNHYPWS